MESGYLAVFLHAVQRWYAVQVQTHTMTQLMLCAWIHVRDTACALYRGDHPAWAGSLHWGTHALWHARALLYMVTVHFTLRRRVHSRPYPPYL